MRLDQLIEHEDDNKQVDFTEDEPRIETYKHAFYYLIARTQSAREKLGIIHRRKTKLFDKLKWKPPTSQEEVDIITARIDHLSKIESQLETRIGREFKMAVDIKKEFNLNLPVSDEIKASIKNL